MNQSNYPPGFTQAHHDAQYAREASCSRCERTLDEYNEDSELCEECELFIADPGTEGL